MTPLETLKHISQKDFVFEFDEPYKLKLLPSMTDREIEELKTKFPNNFIPNEIVDLLKFCRGFEIEYLEEVRFDAIGQFGYEELIPNSIQLCGDGLGNFWVLDIDSKGNWGNVYYVCHDPAVIVKHSNNLNEFLNDIAEYGENFEKSKFEDIKENIVYDIWKNKIDAIEPNKNNVYNFKDIKLPELYEIADLRNVENRIGFSWGKYGYNAQIIRPNDEPIWILEKIIKKSLFSRIFKF